MPIFATEFALINMQTDRMLPVFRDSMTAGAERDWKAGRVEQAVTATRYALIAEIILRERTAFCPEI